MIVVAAVIFGLVAAALVTAGVIGHDNHPARLAALATIACGTIALAVAFASADRPESIGVGEYRTEAITAAALVALTAVAYLGLGHLLHRRRQLAAAITLASILPVAYLLWIGLFITLGHLE